MQKKNGGNTMTDLLYLGGSDLRRQLGLDRRLRKLMRNKMLYLIVGLISLALLIYLVLALLKPEWFG
jgi:K+-transporting ATPase KdpF subunit